MSPLTQCFAKFLACIIFFYGLILSLLIYGYAQDDFLRADSPFFSVFLFDIFNLIVILSFIDLVSFLTLRRSFIIESRFVYLFLALPPVQHIISAVFDLAYLPNGQVLAISLGLSSFNIILFLIIRNTVFSKWQITKISHKAYLLYLFIPTAIVYKVLVIAFA